MTQQKELPAGITAEQVAAFKAQYGERKVRLAHLLDEDGNTLKSVLIRVPDRKVMGEFEKWMDKNPQKSKEILVKNCVLTSVDEVMADDDLFYSAMDAVSELLPLRKSVVESL